MKKVLIAAACAALCLSLHAQTRGSVPTVVASAEAANNELPQLFRERGDLVDELYVLDRDINELWESVRNVPAERILQADLERLQKDLTRAEKRQDAATAESLRDQIDTAQANLKIVRDAVPRINLLEQQQESKSRRMRDIEGRISSLFDTTRDVNEFRSSVTYVFGGLVVLVIAGFYVIAWKKEGVARTIFSGEMGMQFVTLFLIVIAIILFGIMGTLEGKELAALLGGLSGYILGRAGSKAQGKESEPAPKPLPNAAPAES
ncbi:MAG TPA: hypothetical protein VG106_02500 [Vicinamibacterales bacterium]|nr:hypothetical protein [Vicinamibacterales bacterium]